MIVDHKSFIPLLDWVKQHSVVCCITDKGTGKSTRAIDRLLVAEYIVNLRHCCVIRGNDEDVKKAVIEPITCAMDALGCFKKEESDKKIKQDWVINSNGVFFQGKMICLFAYVSRLGSFAGVNHKAELVVFDEFLGGKLTKDGNTSMYSGPDMFKEFKKFIKTITRPMEFKLVMLANGHCTESDLLYGFKFDPSWDDLYQGKDVLEVKQFKDGKTGLFFGSPVPGNIPELQASNDQIDSGGGEDNSEQLFEYRPNSEKRIIPGIKIDNPIYTLKLDDRYYAVGIDGERALVKGITYKQVDGTKPVYASLVDDVGPGVKVLIEERDLAVYFDLFKRRLDGNKVYFSDCYTRDIICDGLNQAIETYYNYNKSTPEHED